MAASKSLGRLREIRQVEEEHSRVVMESAIAELHRVMTALKDARERVRQARVLVASSVQTGELVDRIAGLEEIRLGDRLLKTLTSRINLAENNVKEKRQEFLNKRKERRQAETVCEAMRARETAEANRKNQIALDDWHRSQRNRNMSKASNAPSESDISLTQ
jgi:flagellar export protein FliJ